ncbi:hypothetical protein BGZ83_001365 [Gryganskiella cystojenkinii]|nr:hypothetical protein BGZ83_001365 [Gryganskiella cystojenkinii]
MTYLNAKRSIVLAAVALIAGLFIGTTNAAPILPPPSVDPALENKLGYITATTLTSVVPKTFTKGGFDGVKAEQGEAPNNAEDYTLIDGVLYQVGHTAGEVIPKVLTAPMIDGGLAGVDDTTGIH